MKPDLLLQAPEVIQSPAARLMPNTAFSIQPCGCLLVLDKDLTRIVQCSANTGHFLRVAADELLDQRPDRALGNRLAGRLRSELRSSGRLSGPLSMQKDIKGRKTRLQVNAFRSGKVVIVEIEPITPLGNRRLMGTVNQWLTKLARAATPGALMDVLVAGVRDITRFERSLVFHFDDQGHGVCLAENLAKGLMPVLGQRFAASGYPAEQREKFAEQEIRSIPDLDADAVPVFSSSVLPAGEAGRTDASGAVLRAPSRRQRSFLDDFKARSLLSIAIAGQTGLWGMVTCISATPTPLTPTLRDAARTLVTMATQRLFLLKARMESRFLLQVQESRDYLVEDVKAGLSPSAMLEKYGNEWLTFFRAGGLACKTKGGISGFGVTPPLKSIAQIARGLEQRHGQGVCASYRLKDEPVAEGLDLNGCCGLLAAPLPGEDSEGWLMFFRLEHDKAFYWAGRPESDALVSSPAREQDLRRTFGTWLAEVRGTSEPWKPVECQAAADLGEDIALLASASEITRLNEMLREEQQALAKANEKLREAASHDSLTGIWNRYRTEQELDKELAKARRHKLPFCVLLLDIDHFKKVNDSWGHEAGDELLRQVAFAARGVLRQEDHIGRWGGEEFVVVATGASREDGVVLAERIRAAIADVRISQMPEGVTASIGVATWRPDDKRKELVARADKTMYAAKSGGRNRIETDQGL
ncbi:diguanylate cyclase [Marinobacter sp.]|uniref:sensor domain-containing diguanylate cyclase n=1 Tax=Marinobacter sp. TaxID=50741 RepID=UPI003A917BC2